LAPAIDPWSRQQRADRAGGLFGVVLGDGRRLFANHFFAKADAYFHRGVYPSIFDPPKREEMHMVTEGQSEEEDHGSSEAAHADEHLEPHDPEECTDPTHDHGKAPAASGDWILRLNQHLRPTDHAHLGSGDEREMLPWLRLAAELDPNNTQNFIIPAYWLRTRLGRVDEAEEFLRDGLRHNPGRADLLYELGVIYFEQRKSLDRGRNLLEAALIRWQAEAAKEPQPDLALAEAILVRLALLEENAGNLRRAIQHLEALESITPRPEPIREHMRELRESIERSSPVP
jgi:hypothetical protein